MTPSTAPRPFPLFHRNTNPSPEGKGFISLDKLRAANALPDPITALDVHNAGTLCVSAFHQLHCLVQIPHLPLSLPACF